MLKKSAAIAMILILFWTSNVFACGKKWERIENRIIAKGRYHLCYGNPVAKWFMRIFFR